MKISQNFVAFSEYMNFKIENHVKIRIFSHEGDKQINRLQKFSFVLDFLYIWTEILHVNTAF